MSLDRARLRVLDDAGTLAHEAAAELTRRADECVAAAGRFTLALSGGSTPKRLYGLLADASAPFRSRMPWQQTHFFWGDERLVPADDPRSNFRMVEESLLSKVPVPAENVHRIQTEIGDPSEVAARYEQELRRFFRLEAEGFPRFDLALLGMGPDGHTASLFPGTDALEVRDRLTAAVWVEKLASHRITLTVPVFNHAAAVHFLVSGADKAQTLRAVFDSTTPPDRFPCQRIRPDSGDLLWLVDRAAAGGLATA